MQHAYAVQAKSGPLAQLVEQGTFKPKVAGSTPSRPTIFTRQAHAAKGDPCSFVSGSTVYTGPSSNGRTLVFGTSYLGSNPGGPATQSIIARKGDFAYKPIVDRIGSLS